MRAILLSGLLLSAAQLITAQSLPTCAQACVTSTKVKCKPSDFACACLSEPYVNKLATCFWKTCNEAESHDAVWYLISLCNSVGVVLEKAEPSSSNGGHGNANGDTFLAPEAVRLELRDSHPVFWERQASFTSVFRNTTASKTTGALATSTDDFSFLPTTTAGGSSSTGSPKSHKTANAVSIGLGVTIGLLSLAGIILLAVWFLREHKKERAASPSTTTTPAQYAQPGMTQQQPGILPGAPGYKQPYTAGPAELSQNAQYMGHEMSTPGGNTAEMAANAPPHGIPSSSTPVSYQGTSPPPPHMGYSSPPPQQQAGYNPMHQQQQQGGYYPPPQQQQQYHEVPGIHTAPGSPAPAPVPASMQSQTQTPVQHHIPPQQQQQHAGAAEVPGRSTTPNLYE